MLVNKFFEELPILGLCGYHNLLINSLKSETVNECINYDCPLQKI